MFEQFAVFVNLVEKGDTAHPSSEDDVVVRVNEHSIELRAPPLDGNTNPSKSQTHPFGKDPNFGLGGKANSHPQPIATPHQQPKTRVPLRARDGT
jgi:hypothetical protein